VKTAEGLAGARATNAGACEGGTHVAGLAPAFGVYVHVPFCPSKCPYCDFNTYVGMDDLAPAYFDALVREAEMWASRRAFPASGSYFVGGGTPTMLDEHVLASTIERLVAVFGESPDCEITLESNPESCVASRLAVLRDAGVNRLSIGAQSFADRVLALLGRQHDARATAAAVREARLAGFDNVSLDLIFGVPGETDADWERTLREAVALEPDHVSCYALTIETGTQFGADVAAGRMPAPDDDVQATRYERAIDVLADAGYRHYEISSWGTPSRHNLVYWTQGDYAGLGAGAHSHVDGTRSWNRKNPRAYALDPTRAREGEERLDANARAAEWLQLRLRLVDGLDLNEASRRLRRDLTDSARALQSDGLVALDGAMLRLTRRGLLLENEVALRLSQ
jgi:oxygen-independent coproporphyrinogen-3 oxidase